MPNLFEFSNNILDGTLHAVSLGSIFAVSILEKFMPIVPSYVLFPAIGMGAIGPIDLLLRCLAATVGSVGGAAGWYLLGALIGPRRVRSFVGRYGRWILFTPQLYERSATLYRHRPFIVTLLGQLIPTIRIYQSLPAGVLRLSLPSFLIATGIGAFCWIVPLATAGHMLHHYGWTASQVGLMLLAVLLAVEALTCLAVRYRMKMPAHL